MNRLRRWANQWYTRSQPCYICQRPSTTRYRAQLHRPGKKVDHQLDMAACPEHTDEVRRYFQAVMAEWRDEITTDG